MRLEKHDSILQQAEMEASLAQNYVPVGELAPAIIQYVLQIVKIIV
jgi:hypothetical protein